MIQQAITLTGIVLPALLLIFCVRRWIAPLTWRMAGLLLLLAVGLVARGVFSDGVPVPLDEVVRGWPYRGIIGEPEVRNYLTNDTVKQILPWMAVAREELFHGRAPLWDRYLFCGYPLLANGQSAPFSPFFLVTLFVPLPKQIVAMAGLKVFVALLFGFLLLRREGAGRGGALFGTVIFAFAVFNGCFLYYPMTAVTLLLPAAAYSVLVCVEKRSRASVVMMVLVVGALLAGGHPESVLHVAMGVIVLLGIDLAAPLQGASSWRDRLGGFARATCAALLALAVSAPAWVPVLVMAGISHRVAWLKTIPLGTPTPSRALWAMLEPDGFGNPAHHDWSWVGEYPHVASLYVGLIVLALLPAALFSPRATRRDRMLWMASLGFLLAGLQWTPVARFLYAAPPFSWVAHDRLVFVFVFFAALVAARTVTRLERADLFITLVSSAVLLALFFYVWHAMRLRTLRGPLVFSGAAALILFLAVSLRVRRLAPLAAFVLTAAELFVFTMDYNPLTSGHWFAPKLPIIEALRRYQTAEPFRVVGRDWVLLPNAAAQYGLEDVRGSDPMEWSEYARLFPPTDPFQASVGLRLFPDPDEPILDALNVRFLFAEPHLTIPPKWRRIYSGPDGDLYENSRVLGRFFAPSTVLKAESWEERIHAIRDFRETGLASATNFVNPKGVVIRTESIGPTRYRLQIDAPGRTFVASSAPAMPGWEVRVGGQATTAMRANGVFVGFFVPAGHSEVIVDYRSPAYFTAVLVMVGALLVLGGWALRMGGIRNASESLSSVPERELISERRT